jgi:hypothetical protein
MTTDTDKIEELANWLGSLGCWQGSNKSYAVHKEYAALLRSLSAELTELRQKVSKMEDEWYLPEHMYSVEERTIKPLRQAKESFEWMLKNGFYPKYPNSGIYDRNPIPPYLKSRLEWKK